MLDQLPSLRGVTFGPPHPNPKEITGPVNDPRGYHAVDKAGKPVWGTDYLTANAMLTMDQFDPDAVIAKVREGWRTGVSGDTDYQPDAADRLVDYLSAVKLRILGVFR
jgi:hypothetical protein